MTECSYILLFEAIENEEALLFIQFKILTHNILTLYIDSPRIHIQYYQAYSLKSLVVVLYSGS